jgi:catechol 2,3-dioxygenase-like lactoylglutathione lyase family enzyme
MFKDTRAFSGFSVGDLEAARRFYGETLGLSVSDGPMGTLALHIAGGQDIFVYAKEDHQPATFTILNFPVDDVDAAVDQLRAAGVTIETLPDVDDKGIMRQGGLAIAWFKDPAGNWLAVLQQS